MCMAADFHDLYFTQGRLTLCGARVRHMNRDVQFPFAADVELFARRSVPLARVDRPTQFDQGRPAGGQFDHELAIDRVALARRGRRRMQQGAQLAVDALVPINITTSGSLARPDPGREPLLGISAGNCTAGRSSCHGR